MNTVFWARAIWCPFKPPEQGFKQKQSHSHSFSRAQHKRGKTHRRRGVPPIGHSRPWEAAHQVITGPWVQSCVPYLMVEFHFSRGRKQIAVDAWPPADFSPECYKTAKDCRNEQFVDVKKIGANMVSKQMHLPLTNLT